MSKIIVVTGASVGIGAAILRASAAKGHQVIGLARRAEMIDVSEHYLSVLRNVLGLPIFSFFCFPPRILTLKFLQTGRGSATKAIQPDIHCGN